MGRIKLNYEDYNYGAQFYSYLCRVADTNLSIAGEIKNDYDDLNYSIFDTSSFPIAVYLEDLKDSLNNSRKILINANDLGQYAVDNFTDAEDAIEDDINKFKDKMEKLFGNVDYDGFHYTSESLVYWEPGIDDYTSQGYTETDKYIVVSAYKEGSNSRLYYYDKETGEYIGYVVLENQAHVGGCTYDPDHNLMFVTGEDGKVNCYDHAMIEKFIEDGHKDYPGKIVVDLNNDKYQGVQIECDIDVSSELKTKDAATIYYHDGKLYVATYRAKGDLISYDITCNRDERGKMHLNAQQASVIHNCPSAVQGISIFEKDGKKYIAFARSAKLSPSSIDIYELNDDGTLGEMKGTKTYEHRGLEGIEVHEDGTITGIYEYDGATTLDENVDSIMQNNGPNPNDSAYNDQATFWNKILKGFSNASYDEAVQDELKAEYEMDD